MPALRKCLKHPGTYLALLVALVALAGADTFRPPEHQLSARAYIVLVHAYQGVGRPLVSGFVQCRFRPTCSRYSVEAVQRYGLRKGFALTVARLSRCRRGVPLGSEDPLPELSSSAPTSGSY